VSREPLSVVAAGEPPAAFGRLGKTGPSQPPRHASHGAPQRRSRLLNATSRTPPSASRSSPPGWAVRAGCVRPQGGALMTFVAFGHPIPKCNDCCQAEPSRNTAKELCTDSRTSEQERGDPGHGYGRCELYQRARRVAPNRPPRAGWNWTRGAQYFEQAGWPRSHRALRLRRS
jgi:hypothetical protein